MLTFNLSTWEVKVGGFCVVQAQSGLHSEFPDSQSYIKRPCLKTTKMDQSINQSMSKNILVMMNNLYDCLLVAVSNMVINYTTFRLTRMKRRKMRFKTH